MVYLHGTDGRNSLTPRQELALAHDQQSPWSRKESNLVETSHRTRAAGKEQAFVSGLCSATKTTGPIQHANGNVVRYVIVPAVMRKVPLVNVEGR